MHLLLGGRVLCACGQQQAVEGPLGKVLLNGPSCEDTATIALESARLRSRHRGSALRMPANDILRPRCHGTAGIVQRLSPSTTLNTTSSHKAARIYAGPPAPFARITCAIGVPPPGHSAKAKCRAPNSRATAVACPPQSLGTMRKGAAANQTAQSCTTRTRPYAGVC